jgi:hypothetical protein
VIDQDLTQDGVVVEAVASDQSASAARLGLRRTLMERLEDQCRTLDAVAAVRTFDAYQDRALDLLSAPRVARAFDLASEPATVRDAYGRNTVG